ncbi:MAG: asparagine synthase (glutamine-hydrolyzing) [Bacteroidota bacterium]
MCGINGIISHNWRIQPERFNKVRDTLKHRGPDGASSWFSDDGHVAFGHRRLSFLDLSDNGRQPMSNEDGKIWMTFNGEIYNYLELKQLLQEKGHVFKSQTDSEVIIHGWEEWGESVLNRLEGMFAFAIWDEKEKTLFLARDRFGIKPLYYQPGKEVFFFGSELKAIIAHPAVVRELDITAVCDYLVYRYVPSPKTIWKGINKLPPAHCLKWKRGEWPQIRKYWELGNQFIDSNPEECISKVDQMLESSVKNHIRSDVPIGAFLSGGYDSSALVYYMTKVGTSPNSFSIGFSNWQETEHQYARVVADHLNVPNFATIMEGESLDLVEDLVYHFDEPLADISIIPTYQVSKLARQHNKAVLSGEGADELFIGYNWTKEIALQNGSLKGSSGLVEQYAKAMAMGRFTTKELNYLIHPDFYDQIPGDPEWFYRQQVQSGMPALKTFQYLDIHTFMSELVLTKVDRASMANSLEVRVPFLDHKLVEYLYSFNKKTIFRKSTQKFLLNRILKPVLPQTILNRKKQGFVGPDHYYANFGWFASVLFEGRLLKDEIIQKSMLKVYFDQRDTWRLWKLAVLELWWQKWM